MMRNLAFISVTMVLVWPAVYFAIPGLGYPLQLWAIITSASISAIFAGSIVLLGESIIEDIVLVGILLLLTTALGFAARRATGGLAIANSKEHNNADGRFLNDPKGASKIGQCRVA
jgi:hypothetical protein